MIVEDDATRSTGVIRSTEGIIKITIMQTVNEIKYTSTDETDYRIDGWPGQTLKRDDGTENVDAMTNDEVTVYTNIDLATKKKLTYKGEENVPPLSNIVTIVLDPGQDEDGDLETFTAELGGVPGTFTCDDDSACGIVTMMNSGDDRVVTASIGAGWDFVSDKYVESQAEQDDNYMIFGYWLNSQVDATENPMGYQFDVIVGGNKVFDDATSMDALMANKDDEVLTAVYEGGAAGRYVTRKLRLGEDQNVDPQSPGYHGRFTGRARLEANFGMYEDEDVVEDNSIGGSITNIMDGDKDLGFGVITLGRSMITNTGLVNGDGMAEVDFRETAENTGGTGTGDWNGQFYGPTAAELNAPLIAEDDACNWIGRNRIYIPNWFCWGVRCQFRIQPYASCRWIRGGKN